MSASNLLPYTISSCIPVHIWLVILNIGFARDTLERSEPSLSLFTLNYLLICFKESFKPKISYEPSLRGISSSFQLQKIRQNYLTLVDNLEYHFKTLELNILKGVIGEHLARSFIRNTLAPSLVKEEGWSHVLLSKNDYKQHKGTWMRKLFKFDPLKEDFVVHGFCANRKLLSRYAQVAGVLVENHCTPDGLLMKLRHTGKTRKLKKSACPKVASLKIDASHRHGSILEFPVVDGDLEVVEIKCGREAKLMDKQKKTYNDLIAKGIPLRMINVRIVSFDLNRFLVEEHKYERFL